MAAAPPTLVVRFGTRDGTRGEALAAVLRGAAVCLAGGLTALIVGYAALALLVYLINRGKLHAFAPYCWIVGIAVICLGL